MTTTEDKITTTEIVTTIILVAYLISLIIVAVREFIRWYDIVKYGKSEVRILMLEPIRPLKESICIIVSLK